MALITHDYCCYKVGLATELRIYIPDASVKNNTGPEGTIILLSPEGGSGLDWITSTALKALCEKYGVAAVLVPSLQGCYTDMAYGYPFYTSLKDVRRYLETYLPGVPVKPGKTAVAGVSAGGYAALKWGMEEPELFSCAASFSGLLSVDREPEGWFTEHDLLCLYGDKEARKAESENFLSLCAGTEQTHCFIFSSEDDPGFSSCEETAGKLGTKARFMTASGRSDWKTWSDRLGDFMEYWMGGAQ